MLLHLVPTYVGMRGICARFRLTSTWTEGGSGNVLRFIETLSNNEYISRGLASFRF